MENMEKRIVYGHLTDEDKVRILELSDMRTSIRKMKAKFDTLKKSFWSNIEIRIDVYDENHS